MLKIAHWKCYFQISESSKTTFFRLIAANYFLLAINRVAIAKNLYLMSIFSIRSRSIWKLVRQEKNVATFLKNVTTFQGKCNYISERKQLHFGENVTTFLRECNYISKEK